MSDTKKLILKIIILCFVIAANVITYKAMIAHCYGRKLRIPTFYLKAK